VCSVWVPCVALPSGGGSSVGPSPMRGSPVWVPCVGPLCGSPVWVPSVWVPCVGPLCGSLVALRPCGIYSRDVSRSFTRSRLNEVPCARAPQQRRRTTCRVCGREQERKGGTRAAQSGPHRGPRLGLYKILFNFEAHVHESTIHSLSPVHPHFPP